ncbi:MAG: redoxin domain-containing protein [Akkermansia sp.]|jgi:thiol-disulfide isomerase/thioredoxin|nr:redoxin domain-containing protein [Akkermansia sp.]
MKAIKMLALAMGLCVMTSYVAPAQEPAMDPTEETEAPKKSKKKKDKKKKKAKAGAVAKALKKVKRASGKVNQKALVYVYLQSASWCGPCKQAMPGIVEQYKEMREDGRAEIVLVGWDQTPDGVKSYIEGYKCKMPAVHKDAKNVNKLPGFTPAQGIPFAIMVDAEGNVLKSGSPFVVNQWKAEVEKLEAAAAAAEGDAAEGEE